MRQSADLLTSLQPRFVIEGLASTIDRRPSLSRIVRAGQGSKKKKKKSHDVVALSEIIKKPYSYLRSKMIERKKLIYIYIYECTMSNLASIFEHPRDREITGTSKRFV